MIVDVAFSYHADVLAVRKRSTESRRYLSGAKVNLPEVRAAEAPVAVRYRDSENAHLIRSYDGKLWRNMRYTTVGTGDCVDLPGFLKACGDPKDSKVLPNRYLGPRNETVFPLNATATSARS